MKDNEQEKSRPPKNIKTMKDVNDDDTLVLSSSREVLQIYEKWEMFLQYY